MIQSLENAMLYPVMRDPAGLAAAAKLPLAADFAGSFTRH
jgi:hypothetical protein